jgi:hypothetical protein
MARILRDADRMLPLCAPLPPRSAGEIWDGKPPARRARGLVRGSMKAADAGLRRDDDAMAAVRVTRGNKKTMLL